MLIAVDADKSKVGVKIGVNTKSVRRSIWKQGTGASFQHATTHRQSTISEKHRLGYIFINQLTNSSTLRPLRYGACCTTHLLTPSA